jgi:hypothetical protein
VLMGRSTLESNNNTAVAEPASQKSHELQVQDIVYARRNKIPFEESNCQ